MNDTVCRYKRGTNNTLIVNFSSKGANKADKVIPEFNRTFSALNCSILHVLDKAKSWYQSEESINIIINRINETIKLQTYKKIIFSGVSMGGFGAILFSRYCKADLVVAFSPQIDLLRDKRNKRFPHTLGKIKKFVVPCIKDYFVNDTQYIITYGTRVDKQHIDMITLRPNIKVCHVSNTHVPFTKWKKQGQFINKMEMFFQPE